MKPNCVQPSEHQNLNTFMDHFFNRSIGEFVGRDFTNSSPAVNVTESDAAFRLDLAAPGLKKSDFKLSIDKNQLTISTEQQSDTKEENVQYKRREFNYQTFQRSFQLSKDIDREAIKAVYKNGILAITLPKKEVVEEPVKKIEIS